MGPIRQRKALSCVDCRRRKVKCDRTLPVCDRCLKSGNGEKCTYVPHVGGPSAIPTPSDDSPEEQRDDGASEIDQIVAPWRREVGFARAGPTKPTTNNEATTSKPESKVNAQSSNKELLARVIELETYVRSAGGRPVSTDMMFGIGNPMGAGYQADRNPMSDYDKVMIRGKAFSTQYFGPSFSISLLLQFDELAKFVKDTLSMVPGLEDAKAQMATLRAQSKKLSKDGLPPNKKTLLRMVPDREVIDKYLQFYLETFETTYRILHVPSFKKEYEELLQNPDVEDCRCDFLVQLLLMIASVYCVVPGGPPGYVGRGSARREVAGRWIAVCEQWVNEQSKKHMTLAHFQIHIMIYLAKDMNVIKIKRAWAVTGTLVRLAMAAGMHREPSLLAKKISAFDCEMRRRLWFTIVELDLSTTVDRGLTPTLDSFGYDCLPPRNVHDEEFDESTEILPPSRPRTEFTRTAWLHCMQENLSLRMDILGRVNSIRLCTDLEIVMQFDNKLRKVIDDLPSWEQHSPDAKVAEPLMLLILYEYILFLHIPLAGQTPYKARFLYSLASKRDAAFKCLKIYAKMPELYRRHLIMRREDHGRAALSLCHDIVNNVHEDPMNNIELLSEYMKMCVDFLEQRARDLGQGFHGYWIGLTSYSLAQWKLSGEASPDRFAKHAGSKVIELFYNSILEKQVPMPSLNGSTVDESMLSPSISSNRNVSIDGVFPNFQDIDDTIDPMWDFMSFDFSSVWNLDSYPGF